MTEEKFLTDGQFYADAAHELRTPLAVVLAQCESIKRHPADMEALMQAVETIHVQAKRMEYTMAQVLKMHRLAEKHYELDKEKVQLEELIQAVCEDEAGKWKEKPVFRLSVQISEIYADAGLLIIMLQNLIGNAVKYSMEYICGEKEHKDLERKAVVEISACRKNGNIIIKIKDYGCGIPAGKINAVFLPFYKAEGSLRRSGCGLGLSIAERIARMHGGSVCAESVQGKGSTFTVMLPQQAEVSK